MLELGLPSLRDCIADSCRVLQNLALQNLAESRRKSQKHTESCRNSQNIAETCRISQNLEEFCRIFSDFLFLLFSVMSLVLVVLRLKQGCYLLIYMSSYPIFATLLTNWNVRYPLWTAPKLQILFRCSRGARQ